MNPWTTPPPPDEWATPVPVVVPDATPKRRAGDTEALVYECVEDWFTGWLSPLYRRKVTSAHRIWCPRPFRHAEVRLVLEQLWLQWEAARQGPNGAIGDWKRDSLDHHMGVLMDPEGPLQGCRYDRHSELPLPPLPALPEDPTEQSGAEPAGD